MESDVNTSRTKSHQNGPNNDTCMESQGLTGRNSLDCDKTKKKMLQQSNTLVPGINGLTRTNGLTNSEVVVLSTHASALNNGNHEYAEMSSERNCEQGEVIRDLTEQQESDANIPNGELEKKSSEQDNENKVKMNVTPLLSHSDVNEDHKPVENGYGGDNSNSEDELNDSKTFENRNVAHSDTNICLDRSSENAIGENKGHTFMQNKSPKMQAARPKTISWSRMVKQRKDKKNRANTKSQNSSKLSYLYPELCSSSEDEEVHFSSSNKQLSDRYDPSNCHTGANGNASLNTNNSSQRQFDDDSDSGQNCLIGMLLNGHESIASSSSIGQNENQRMQTLHDVDIMNSSLISAPLALPEESDGYSTNSSDSNTKPSVSSCPRLTTTTKTTTTLTCTTNSRTLITQTSQFIYTERTTIDNICFEENRNVEQAMRPRPLPQNSSMDSLEEIGDYIETDFPNKDSRLLFQCSSQSSTSTDEDEGYGVNEVSQNVDMEPEGRSLPPESSFSLSHTRQNLDTNQLDSKVSGSSKLCGCNDVNVSFPLQQKRLSRLGSSTGKSESGSEIGGPMGSDSSVLYSPETDFMEFLETDLPVPIGLGDDKKSSSLDMLNPCLSNADEKHNDSANTNSICTEFVDDHEHCVLNYGTNDLRGAEGGLTNDLNFDCRSDDFDPDPYNNVESYDPYLADIGNENFHYHRDICKHEKVPRANFQNSESNRQEKIFFKCAMDGNQSSSSGSSDDEENLLHCMPREVIFNPDRPPQNSDDTDCMVLEDLEHLTHALQNAVIMQLPSKLEESSGDSSEEPIYEDIDNLELHSITASDILPVLPEEPPKNPQNVVKVLPKYERRKRRGHRSHSDVEKVMIWNEYEAYVLQVKQIGTSACGATAILNVMKAFDFQIDKEEVCKNVQTNLRMEAAPIPYYLFSRSSAGTTADNLIEGIERLTQFTIKGRFFHFYPPRKVELLKWLGYWIKKGAVPVATLNLQCGVKPGWTIPDAWHHQMVYGVSSKGVYLTNPLEIVPEEVIMEQLTSDSVLLIRRQDVVNRFRDWAPLNDILKQREKRWQTMNVLGQVVNVLREACTALSHQVPRYRAQLTSHISVPAAYKAGVTLFVRNNTDLCNEVFSAPDLELKETPDEASPVT